MYIGRGESYEKKSFRALTVHVKTQNETMQYENYLLLCISSKTTLYFKAHSSSPAAKKYTVSMCAKARVALNKANLKPTLQHSSAKQTNQPRALQLLTVT